MKLLETVKNFTKSWSVLVLAQAALRAPPEVALQYVAGHCYFQILVSLSFSLFLRILLFTHFSESPEAENLFPPIFWHN